MQYVSDFCNSAQAEVSPAKVPSVNDVEAGGEADGEGEAMGELLYRGSDTAGSSAEEGGGSIVRWSNIAYSVVSKDGEKKQLLSSMSGEAFPGEILAVMGTSGAGKTTLLDVLAGRLHNGKLKGIVTVNGNLIDKTSFRKKSGYVMQNDALFPLLTVRETMLFAAYLRLPDMSIEEKARAADDMINLMRLQDCVDTHVGDSLTPGISGGQKRRLSIGIDILHQPSVIFLDEPTSGLDSMTALSIIEALKQIAIERASTIIMTIHQPSAKLFNALDKVLFLAGGKVTYNGPVPELMTYIEKIYAEVGYGNVPMETPPELFLDLCEQLDVDGKMDVVVSNFADVNPDSYKSISGASGKEPEALPTVFANGLLGDVYFLSMRMYTNILRTKELFFARLMSAVTFGVLIGTLFLNTQDTDLGLQHRVSYFVFTLAFFYYTSLEALPIFLSEREIFQREYSSGAYRAAAYTIASSVVYYPFMLLISIVYVCITWFLVGLDNVAAEIFFQILAVFITLVTGQTFATMFSVLVPDPMAGELAVGM
jgi:ATP-binding cassette subfamily G (WHITE) protein 2